MGQVTKVRLSCYLVLLSFDSRPGNKTAALTQMDYCHVASSHHLLQWCHISTAVSSQSLWIIPGVNTLRPRQDGCQFPDIFKCIFLNENIWISLEISLKFAPRGPINNIPALVQIMAWRRPGDKPLSEPMIVYWRIYVSLGLNELRFGVRHH